MKIYVRKANNNDFVYPEEMRLILNYLNSHGTILINESAIEDLYFTFSEDKYCASWMSVNKQRLEEFEDWLSRIDI